MEGYTLSPDTKKLLRDINFIAYCPKGKKISFTLQRYVEPNVYSIENLRRMCNLEGRQTTIEKIDKVLSETGQFLLSNHNKPDVLQLFFDALKDMKEGLENLKNTYKNEADITSSLVVNMKQLEIYLKNLEKRVNEGELTCT